MVKQISLGTLRLRGRTRCFIWKIKVGRRCDEDRGKGTAKENPDYKVRWRKVRSNTKIETD